MKEANVVGAILRLDRSATQLGDSLADVGSRDGAGRESSLVETVHHSLVCRAGASVTASCGVNENVVNDSVKRITLVVGKHVCHSGIDCRQGLKGQTLSRGNGIAVLVDLNLNLVGVVQCNSVNVRVLRQSGGNAGQIVVQLEHDSGARVRHIDGTLVSELAEHRLGPKFHFNVLVVRSLDEVSHR